MRLLTGFLLLLTAWAGTGPEIPKTVPGEVLQQWLDAFNSGDRAKLSAYLQKYEPQRLDRIDDSLGFRERTGGFTLIRVDKSEPLSLDAIVKEREGSNYGRLELELTEGDPPMVKRFGIHIVPRPADQPEQPRLTFNNAVEALDRQAAELAGKDQFSGCVLVARGGKVALEKAYGLADRDRHISNTLDTKFRIGSMNKMFTATAILQLVGDGKIDLSAPLGKYLPDYPNRDAAAKVTIRELLSHTGGMGDIFTPEYDQKRLQTRELSDYVKLFGSRAPEFEPGSKWSYSNYGFVLLGVVIQKVSGMSYYDYVRRNIFAKAGMHDTDSLPESEPVPLRSTGYLRKDGKWAANSDTLPWRGTSAGGGYSTVGDLLRFAEALSSGKLIRPELFSQMTSAQEGEGHMPPGMHYGFGMTTAPEPQGPRFGHGGGAPGMNGELRIYPKTDTVVAVLANLDPPAATRIADFFDERMPVD
jgi:CubicO group peptidase (beta-lactamase class C family)